MAHEGESTDHLEDLSGGGGGSRSTRVLATIVTWTISAFKTRGINIDPSFKLDRSALKRVTRVVMVLPLVNGAAALLELLSRLILLILFLALSCAPRHRTVMVERFRATMRMHVQSVRRLSSLTDVEDTSARRPKSSLPPEATVLIVGHSAVGKTALGDALHRLARKVGSQPPPRACSQPGRRASCSLPCRPPAAPLPTCAPGSRTRIRIGTPRSQAGREDGLVVAESHGLLLPSLEAFPELKLLIIVWEAALGTSLPAYVANYTKQLEQKNAPPRSLFQRTLSIGAGGSASTGSVDATPSAVTEPLPHHTRQTSDETTPTAESDASSVTAAGTLDRAAPAPDARKREGDARLSTVGSKLGAMDAPSPPTAPAAVPPAAELAGAEGAATESGAFNLSKLRVLVVCNKTDTMPCPMPQIRGLKPEHAFIAVSALRCTNLGHMWTMVAPVLSLASD